MIYNETIVIQKNKAKRILELCKNEGIELFDSINDKSRGITGTSMKNFQKQVENDTTSIFAWSEKTRDKIEEIFLTPRLVIEFNKKNKLEEAFPTNPYGLQEVVKKALLRQIYFLEIVINEIDEYRITAKTKNKAIDVQTLGLKNYSANLTD